MFLAYFKVCIGPVALAIKIDERTKYPNLPPEKENRNSGGSCHKQEHSPRGN